MSTFQWDDPFLIDDQLTTEERQIRDACAAFAEDRLRPRISEAYLGSGPIKSLARGMVA